MTIVARASDWKMCVLRGMGTRSARRRRRQPEHRLPGRTSFVAYTKTWTRKSLAYSVLVRSSHHFGQSRERTLLVATSSPSSAVFSRSLSFCRSSRKQKRGSRDIDFPYLTKRIPGTLFPPVPLSPLPLFLDYEKEERVRE